MRRVLALGLAALAFAAAGCGGGEDEAANTSSPPAEAVPEREVAQGADGSAPGDTSPEPGAERGGSTRGGGARVDLSTDPESIPAARVTDTGAVQTLPPRPEAHRVAQRNTYSSIKAFGAEAEGDEATEITFALVQYLHAKANGDWATACARLYSPLLPALLRLGAAASGGEAEQIDCPTAFEAAMRSVPPAVLTEQATIDVSSVRRGEEDRAFVIYKTPDTLSVDMPLYLEDGVWKVAAIEPYSLDPGQAG